MAEINLPTLLKKHLFLADGSVSGIDESTAYFVQSCVQNAVWKDSAEAQAVLDILIKLADHKSVRDDDGGLQRMMLISIVIVVKAARGIERPS